jgi:hypothetical protein
MGSDTSKINQEGDDEEESGSDLNKIKLENEEGSLFITLWDYI